MWRALLSVVVLAGCAGGPAASPAPDGGAGGDRDLAAPADLAPPVGACAGDDGGGACVSSVTGRVVDEEGHPVPDLVVSFCADACYFGKSDKDGAFSVAVEGRLDVARYALLVHARPDHASFYAPPPPVVGGRVVFPEPLVTPTLPADGPLIALDDKAQTLTAGGVTLEIRDGTTIFLDPEDVEAGDPGRELRPVRIADPTRYPFIDRAGPPLALWALSPFEAVLSRPARLTLPATGGLAPGTPVDFLAQRSLLGGPPPAGPLETVAAGRVSDDGKRFEMDPGAGLLVLTWVAVIRR